MRLDPDDERRMAATSRRGARRPWLPLLSAVLGLAGGKAELLRHTVRPWASVTFSGSRHVISLSFTGEEAMAAGEAFIETLPEHEFAIPGKLVADATVVAVEQQMQPEPKLTVEAELLVLDEV
jgi:hypothetical protein